MNNESYADRPLPPLRIHHMLVATAATAGFMWVAKLIERRDVIGMSTFIGSSMGVMYCIATALALTATGYGIHWRRRGSKFFHQPGHWLLVEQALGIWIVAVALIGVVESPNRGINQIAPILAPFFICLNLAIVGINFFVAWRVADTRPWQVFFVLSGAIVIGNFVWPLFAIQTPQVFAYVNFAGQLLLLIALLAAAVRDRRSNFQRDWAHWLGVLIHLAVFLTAFVPQIIGLMAQLIAS